MLSISLIWIPLAIIAGIFSAIMMLINQYYKVPGLILVILSRSFILLALLPGAFFINWPDEPIYYITIAITGIIAGFADIRMFNVTAKLGGGVVSRLIPLMIPITFIGWFIIQPSDIIPYLAMPLHSLAILATLTGCVFFSFQLKNNCEISKDGLRLMMPVILGYAINTILAKFAMNNANLYEGIYGYMIIQSVFVLLFTLSYYRQQLKTTILIQFSMEKRLILASIFIGIIWISHIATKISSFTFIDNPAYPNALVLLAPVWVILFYKIAGHKEKANSSAGIGILISTILLILLTAR